MIVDLLDIPEDARKRIDKTFETADEFTDLYVAVANDLERYQVDEPKWKAHVIVNYLQSSAECDYLEETMSAAEKALYVKLQCLEAGLAKKLLV